VLDGLIARFRRRMQPSLHGRYTSDYRTLVKYLISTQPRARAMEIAAGHDDRIGDVEFSILDHYGLRDDSYLIDVGCGAGRLARRAAMVPKLRYLGTDVSEDLLSYAQESCRRPDFRFLRVDSVTIPEEDDAADMVAFFSVGTHLLHEEFFVYLDDARRVLKRGGRIVFSFLDFQSGTSREVFKEMVRKVRTGLAPPHLDMFIGRDDIAVWADLLGMDLVETTPGDVVLSASERVRAVLGREPPALVLGQSIAVLAKRG